MDERIFTIKDNNRGYKSNDERNASKKGPVLAS